MMRADGPTFPIGALLVRPCESTNKCGGGDATSKRPDHRPRTSRSTVVVRSPLSSRGRRGDGHASRGRGVPNGRVPNGRSSWCDPLGGCSTNNLETTRSLLELDKFSRFSQFPIRPTGGGSGSNGRGIVVPPGQQHRSSCHGSVRDRHLGALRPDRYRRLVWARTPKSGARCSAWLFVSRPRPGCFWGALGLAKGMGEDIARHVAWDLTGWVSLSWGWGNGNCAAKQLGLRKLLRRLRNCCRWK